MPRKLALIATLAITLTLSVACGSDDNGNDVSNDPDIQQTIEVLREEGSDKPDGEVEEQIDAVVDHASKLDEANRASYLELVRNMAETARESRNMS